MVYDEIFIDKIQKQIIEKDEKIKNLKKKNTITLFKLINTLTELEKQKELNRLLNYLN